MLDKTETPFVFVETLMEDGEVETIMEEVKPQLIKIRRRAKSEDNILALPVLELKKKQHWCT